jgi:hypothetical protein
MPSVAGSNIHFPRRSRHVSVPNGWPALFLSLPLFQPRGKRRATSVTAAITIARERPGSPRSLAARISVMAATLRGHGSGVEPFVGGLLSARLIEVLSGGRSSCSVFQSVSRIASTHAPRVMAEDADAGLHHPNTERPVRSEARRSSPRRRHALVEPR